MGPGVDAGVQCFSDLAAVSGFAGSEALVFSRMRAF
jgi:hypothetical protein